MSSNSFERKQRILQAIVADYVDTQEPVGSKALVEKYNLDVSSATVRKDMSELEEQGYILAPHKSAGRIPTDKGYRAFVDMISDIKPLSTPEKQAITKFLTASFDLDTILNRAVQLLSRLTNQVALVQYPILSASKILHLELVKHTEYRLILIVIADSGRVEQRIIELNEALNDDLFAELKQFLQTDFINKNFMEAVNYLENDQADIRVPVGLITVWPEIKANLISLLKEKTDTKILLGGTANLTKNMKDFSNNYEAMSSILDDLEEQVVLLKIMNITAQQKSNQGKVAVQIGVENSLETFKPTSIITSFYGTLEKSYGNIGIIGPTRMDYPNAMAKVAGVAQYIGQIIFENK